MQKREDGTGFELLYGHSVAEDKQRALEARITELETQLEKQDAWTDHLINTVNKHYAEIADLEAKNAKLRSDADVWGVQAEERNNEIFALRKALEAETNSAMSWMALRSPQTRRHKC